ncbi:hypothetical protein ONZ45_g6004 [Pleurotus djamor]|nr:hypothetical protein ONZ45_g6004 [Pleurotus djamor]
MASTLTSLHLLSPYHLGTDELFDKFGRFPRLTRLVLCPLWVDGSLNTTPILKFISEQTPHLADLSLIPQSKHAFWTPFITQLKDQSLPLPQLKALSLSHPPDDFDVVLTLIRHTLDTLECLSLQECRLSYDKFLALATTLGGAPSSRISSLTLDVEILCPAILDTLYRQLPGLQSLEVVYKGIGGTYLNQNGKAQLKDVRPVSSPYGIPFCLVLNDFADLDRLELSDIHNPNDCQ